MGHWAHGDANKLVVFSILKFVSYYTLLSFVLNNKRFMYSFGFTQTSNFVSLIVFQKLIEILIFLFEKIEI